MGCNCDKDTNKLLRFAKGNAAANSKNWLLRATGALLQLTFGVLVGVILVVLIVPLLIYITACIMMGKQPSVKLFNPRRGRGVKNSPDFVQDARKRLGKRMKENNW